MRFKLSNGCSKYGAQMGRMGDRGDPDYEYKFRLQHLPLDSGGYDSGGAYWGFGQRLYRAEGEIADGDKVADAVEYFRASNREEAKQKIREMYPNATFYR